MTRCACPSNRRYRVSSIWSSLESASACRIHSPSAYSPLIIPHTTLRLLGTRLALFILLSSATSATTTCNEGVNMGAMATGHRSCSEQ